MKPFLGVDLTENKNNEKLNGTEFILQTPSESNTQALHKAIDNSHTLINKAKIPLALRIIKAICGFVGMILTASIFRAWDTETSFSQMYETVPLLFWIAGACLIIFGMLEIISRKKAKSTLESDEGNHTKSSLDTVVNNIYAELGVPASLPETDILSFCYKIKDGEPHAKARGLEVTPYNNLIFKVFSDSENLYIANCDAKYSFPISQLKGIKTVKKRISLADWNKDEKPNKGEFKKYKLTTDSYDRVHVKPYHILEIEHNSEIYGVYFPCYELPVFERATGLKAEL